MDSFIALLMDLLSTKKIPEDKILEVANVAEDFSHFGDVSQDLFERTVNKLPCVIKDLYSLKNFKSTVKTEDSQLFSKMIAFIKERSVLMSFCDNDWSSMLEPDSLMPPDVKVIVAEEVDGIRETQEFSLHHFLLASHSSLFKVSFRLKHSSIYLNFMSVLCRPSFMKI